MTVKFNNVIKIAFLAGIAIYSSERDLESTASTTNTANIDRKKRIKAILKQIQDDKMKPQTTGGQVPPPYKYFLCGRWFTI